MNSTHSCNTNGQCAPRRRVWRSVGAAIALSAVALGLTLPRTLSTGNKAQAAPLKASAAKLAPELVGATWLNTPGNKPVTLASRRGQVTIVEFWTFACGNCRANLPAYAKWQEKFASRGVQVIGVHTPETAYERNADNVRKFVKAQKITYPTLLDADGKNWNRWNQQYWPAIYVIDKAGRVRFTWTGELEFNRAGGTQQVEAVVERLLNETTPANAPAKPATAPMARVVKTDAQWKALLSPASYNVLRHEGTEPAWSGDLKDHGAGVYQCAGCGLELFNSSTKFDSGTGWPSFYRALPGHVSEITDTTLGMSRTAVDCARCGGHLGHVFDDGPKPTGLRYCMNSVSLHFEKK